jgi:diaminopimelate decarboxylase
MLSPLAGLQDNLLRIFSKRMQWLPSDLLHNFVRSYIDRSEYYRDIVETHGSPLYLLDQSALTARAARLMAAFENVFPSVEFFYAVKSNPYSEVVKTLLVAHFGLDVSSGMELEMALNLGAQKIVFSGPGKSADELQLAVKYADRVVVLMDSWGELKRLEAIAAASRQRVRCGVRLTTDPVGLWRKFGIPLEALPDFWQAAEGCDHVEMAGIQFHTSWSLSPNAQIAFIEKLGKIMGIMPKNYASQIEFIDIGGGYWPEQGEWLHPRADSVTPFSKFFGSLRKTMTPHLYLAATPIESFAEQLGDAIHKHIFSVQPCRICIEPGRWLSHAAMHLIISVVDKKAPDLVITDAGTNAVGWERFESDYFPVVNLSRPSLVENPCHILGSLCTPHDVWGYFYFGESIDAGDILMIPTQGAYTYSLRQEFIKPLPKVVFLN